MRYLLAIALLVCALAHRAPAQDDPRGPRIAAFNLQDLRARDVDGKETARAADIAALIRSADPDVILLSEVAYEFDAPEGRTLARRFVARFLAEGGEPIYEVFDAPVNTGIHSGHDLDNNGVIAHEPGSREYGGDCLGYGTFPGQYGMALLVRREHEILEEDARTFRTFLWKQMPGALLPPAESGGGGWYSDEELAVLPFSSKSHWDVPVRMRDGRLIHFLCSHPTPPVFDGPEDRNGRRNHDEIRFWIDYVTGVGYMTDDRGQRGPLPEGASFVILGDLNADPDEGDTRADPAAKLLAVPRIADDHTPTSDRAIPELDADDTARFGLRVDYVLPSEDLPVARCGMIRTLGEGGSEEFPSDHFLIWCDLAPVEPTTRP